MFHSRNSFSRHPKDDVILPTWKHQYSNLQLWPYSKKIEDFQSVFFSLFVSVLVFVLVLDCTDITTPPPPWAVLQRGGSDLFNEKSDHLIRFQI